MKLENCLNVHNNNLLRGHHYTRETCTSYIYVIKEQVIIIKSIKSILNENENVRASFLLLYPISNNQSPFIISLSVDVSPVHDI